MMVDNWAKPLSSTFPTGKCDEKHVLRLVLIMLLGNESDLYIKSTQPNFIANSPPSSSSSLPNKTKFDQILSGSKFELTVCAHEISLPTLGAAALQSILQSFAHLGSLLLPMREILRDQNILLLLKELGKDSQLNVCLDTLASLDEKIRIIYAENFTMDHNHTDKSGKPLLLPSDALDPTSHVPSLTALNELLFSSTQLRDSLLPPQTSKDEVPRNNTSVGRATGSDCGRQVKTLLGLYTTTRPWHRIAHTICVSARRLLLECASSSGSVHLNDHQTTALLRELERHALWSDLTTSPSVFPSLDPSTGSTVNGSIYYHESKPVSQYDRHAHLRTPTYHLATRAYFHSAYNHLLGAALLSVHLNSQNAARNGGDLYAKASGGVAYGAESLAERVVDEMREMNRAVSGGDSGSGGRSSGGADPFESPRTQKNPLSLHGKEKQRLAVNKVMSFHLTTSLAQYRRLNEHFLSQFSSHRSSNQHSDSDLRVALDLLLKPNSHPQLLFESSQLFAQQRGRFNGALVQGDNPNPFVHPTQLLLHAASSATAKKTQDLRLTSRGIEKHRSVVTCANTSPNSAQVAESLVHSVFPPSSLLRLTVERPLRAYMRSCEGAYIQSVLHQGKLRACQLLLSQIFCLSDPTVFAPLSDLLLAATHYASSTPIYAPTATDTEVGTSSSDKSGGIVAVASTKKFSGNSSVTAAAEAPVKIGPRQRRSVFDPYDYSKSDAAKGALSKPVHSLRMLPNSSLSVDPSDRVDCDLLWSALSVLKPVNLQRPTAGQLLPADLSISNTNTQAVGRLVRRLNQSLTVRLLQVLASADSDSAAQALTPCCQLLSSSPLSPPLLTQSAAQTRTEENELLVYELACIVSVELKFRAPASSLLTESVLNGFSHTLRALLPLSILRTAALHMWKPVLSHHTHCTRASKTGKSSSVPLVKVRKCYTGMGILVHAVGRLWSHYMTIIQERILPQLGQVSALQSIAHLRAVQLQVSAQLCALVDLCATEMSRLIRAAFQFLAALRGLMMNDASNVFAIVETTGEKSASDGGEQERQWEVTVSAADTFHASLTTLARSVRALEEKHFVHNHRNNADSDVLGSATSNARVYYDIITSFVESLAGIVSTS